ncbi:MAG: 5'-nucleotidase C-terminal domain-containing protein, partial [Muribaculaceae bacterium]|nr:5'-nucleotidase C-terminal domain-containing protein [Muribaculaceae bacterium]
LKSIVIGKSQIDTNDRAAMPLHNFVSSFLADRGARLTPGEKIDLAISNRGGVRTGMAKGNVTKGNIMEMLPFDNRVLVLDVKGSDLLESIAVNTHMHRVSYDRNVTAAMNGDELTGATIEGKPIDPDATYRVATIDYIANGGDYMKPLTNGKVVAKSGVIMNEDVMDYISRLPRKTIKNDTTDHFTVIAEQ